MALTKCQECGKTISVSAIQCPDCGAPARIAIPRGPHANVSRMKEVGLAMVMVGIIAFFIGAVGDQEEEWTHGVVAIGLVLVLFGILVFALSGARKSG